MRPVRPPDPGNNYSERVSSNPSPDFAERLGTAIRERGLALSRIRDRLQQQGLEVSIATLSYWTSGRSRPVRSRSLEIVRALEILLGTRPGWLVEAIPGPSPYHSLADVLKRKELLAAAVEEHHLHTAADWRTLSVYRHAFVDADRTERACENWMVLQAITPRAQGYTTVVEGHAGSVEARGLGLVSPSRIIQVADDLFVIEFMLDMPVPRGERVMLGDRIDFVGERPETDGSGYAVKGATPEVVLQVTFAGPMPRDFRVTSMLPDQDGELVRERPPLVGKGSAQAVLTDVGAGVHGISWDW